MKRRQFILSLAGTAAVGLTGWQFGRHAIALGRAKVKRTGWALGTNVTLTIYHDDSAAASQALEEAFQELNRIEDIMSLYRSESQVSRLNRNGSLPQPDAELLDVLETASNLSAQTNGMFDVTVQPLWDLHYQHSLAGTSATDEELQAALAKVDWKGVETGADRIRFKRAGMAVTLNGIAQGFAADAVGRVLQKHGIEHALIDTGEISTIGGRTEQDAWSIGIKHPRREDLFLCLAALQGRCLATSGDYETRFTSDYSQHHLLDPHTGRSPSGLSSVTVVASTAMQADALSTAVFLLGETEGRRLIESTPEADALFVTKDGQRSQTKDFPIIS